MELEAGERHGAAGLREVVLVGPTHSLDQSMGPQTLEMARDLGGGELGDQAADVSVAYAADGVLAAQDDLEKPLVGVGEEVEAVVATAAVGRGPGERCIGPLEGRGCRRACMRRRWPTSWSFAA